MNCFYHPERAAIGTCPQCGKSVCPECQVAVAGKRYCTTCAGAPDSTASVGIAAQREIWFARHLNWTTVLTWVGAAAMSFIAGFVVGVVMYGSDFAQTEKVAFFAGYLSALAWLLVTNGWVLRKKGRSEWHLLLLLVPFGFVFLVALQNRNAVSRMTDPPTPAD